MTDVSTDIETLGTSRGSVVLSIGAVRFDPNDTTIYDEFYRNIDPLDCILNGMNIDYETVNWWRKPELEAARQKLTPNRVSLRTALVDFADWINVVEPGNIWAKPPQFDCNLLEGAYCAVGLPVPWQHRQPTCVRTVIRWESFDDKSVPFEGIEHYALDDAVHQAKIVQLARAKRNA